MREILQLQLKTKEDQLSLVNKRIRIAREIEKKNMGVSWEEMQEFLGHEYQHSEQQEDREQQLIDPALFVQISADLSALEKRLGKEIEKLRSQLAKMG
ncbi:MAG: hypothetical protein ACO1NU_11285 [Arcticibacter sp.]